MAMLAENFVEEEDILKFEEKYKMESESGTTSINTQFQYACCLVRSKYKDDIRKGIELFSDLCNRGCDQRDFLFFLGLGYYKLGDYATAMKFTQRLLTIEPSNHQARELEGIIDEKQKKDGLVGLAVVGGVVALGGALLGMMFAKKS